ncbi:MAG TPA: hypothetical protein VFK40_04390 [Nitrososphaeraceae archaeon]|jgi:hypothetical protein|nr:hypothetical protein [Nitrososphaeraceae archaeon]HJT85768.1 hypothetical protein [Nitrososphaeraceae archaeon]
MTKNLFNFNEYIKKKKNDKNTAIVIGLFALIGFIILVYSIFILIFRDPSVLVANIVVVAIFMGFFTSVGVIMSKRMLNQ